MALIAFLLTLLELGAAAMGYFLQSQPLFSFVVIYGSPIYLFKNLFGADSVMMSGNMVYLGAFIFHVIKYITFVRTQMVGEGGALFWLAVIFEASYLLLSAYYTFSF